MEQSILLLHKLKYCYDDPSSTPPWPEFSIEAQEALGIYHLMQLVIRNEARPEFAKLVPHLELLNQGIAVMTKAASPTDEASNKIFELITGLAALEVGRDLKVDDPVRSSKGKNPDVLITLPDGLVWGFACKVVCGDADKSLLDLMASGVEQIERSPADIGIVLLSFKNRFPHEEFLLSRPDTPDGETELVVFAEKKYATDRMALWVKHRFALVYESLGRESIFDIFLGKKALPGVLVSQEVVTRISVAGVPTLSVLNFLHLVGLEFTSVLYPPRINKRIEKMVGLLNKGFRIL